VAQPGLADRDGGGVARVRAGRCVAQAERICQEPAPETPRLSKVSQILTASWTRGDNTYVLGNSSRHQVSQTDCREPFASSSLPLMNEHT
jgi:hypothetical protein